MEITMEENLRQVAKLFMNPPFDSESRALLYLHGKREDLIVDALQTVLQNSRTADELKREIPVSKDQINLWNETLKARGYFKDKSGLKSAKQRGRIDLARFDANSNPTMLIEVKAWSATDAVDDSRYTHAKRYNHSLLKSFEIDALKLIAAGGDQKINLAIVTALFTLHCDDMTVSQMKKRKLKFIPLLMKQNSDKAGIGNSDAYRVAGVNKLTSQFESSFGIGTPFNAKITHVSAFGRSDAIIDGVALSLDLIGAELSP
jgi:hypothetical protein